MAGLSPGRAGTGRAARWSRARARERHEHAGRVMWGSLLWGALVLGIVNAVQLVAGWPAYRHPGLAVAILLALAGSYVLAWWRGPGGIGPLVSAGLLLTGPAACLAIATQLGPQDLTGLANFVSGFSVMPLILLPFARPVEEIVAGVAALAGAQVVALQDDGRSVRDLHTVVLTGGAGATIAVGTAFLVAAVRQLVRAGDELRERTREALWRQTLDERFAGERTVAFTRAETEAARLLEAIGTGALDPSSPDVAGRARRLGETLRAELTATGRPSLLRTQIQHGGAAGVEVDDEDNLAVRMRVADRTMLVRAVLEVAPGAAWAYLGVRAVGRRRAQVAFGVAGRAVPGTPLWRTLTAGRGHLTSVEPGRWFLDLEVPLSHFPWEPT